ncbi:hypothetical protein MZM54_03245 [[Brevibacterium] frigoritolerans]|nr:hypothetical protein [Peribacillus frigoritolerans]
MKTEIELIPQDEIYELAKDAENSQDGGVLALLFENVPLERIKQLKEKDLNDLEFQRQIGADALKIVKNALEEKQYIDEDEEKGIYRLEKSKYVFRDASGKKLAVEELENRVKRIGRTFGYTFDAQLIIRSGEQYRNSN